MSKERTSGKIVRKLSAVIQGGEEGVCGECSYRGSGNSQLLGVHV